MMVLFCCLMNAEDMLMQTEKGLGWFGMPDREKVISTFEKIISVCKEDGCDFVDLTFEDAERILALLKEQEAVEPILIREGRNKNYNDYVCPRCDNDVFYEQNYCSECGVRFLWEGR